jgi:hypothetical protein
VRNVFAATMQIVAYVAMTGAAIWAIANFAP